MKLRAQAPGDPVTGITLRVDGPAERLDRYVAARSPGLSRAQVQRLIAVGRVQVNGMPARSSYLPAIGDLIVVALTEDQPSAPAPNRGMSLEIIYEDQHLLVVNKAAGMVVHPAPGHVAGTLVDALLARRPDLALADLDPQRPGIVHRLDRDTSGLLVVAATRLAQVALQAQFKARTVEKTYLALVYGHLEPEQGAIEAPLCRDPVRRTRMQVASAQSESGGRVARAARTEYRVRQLLAGCTLLEAKPLTGRTHQVRVHLAAIGHPLVGDRAYGYWRQEIPSPRQFLHAWRLAFDHPATGERLSFAAELPADLQLVLQRVQQDCRPTRQPRRDRSPGGDPCAK